MKGVFSCPKSPANPAWPTNNGIAAFIPLAPLAPRMLHTARFEFVGGEVFEWSFETGK